MCWWSTPSRSRPPTSTGSYTLMKHILSGIEIDRYQLFLVIVLGGLGVFTAMMLAIAIWLFRRNRRLPRLVHPKRRR